MRVLSLIFLFLATVAVVNAVVCTTDCLECKDTTLNPCTIADPTTGTCIPPCTIPKPTQAPVACPQSCELCKDKTLNSCWVRDPVTNTCVKPCSQPKCPQNQNCGINGVWDGVNCQCVVNTPAPCMGKCSAGFHWDSTSCKCVCTETELCIKGKHFDHKKCACVDNQPTKPVCVDKIDCLDGYGWNPVDCKCEPKVQCVADPCSNKRCEFGACTSNYIGGCHAICPCDPNGPATCQSGQWWNSQTCACEKCSKQSCAYGKHWDPLACQCVAN